LSNCPWNRGIVSLKDQFFSVWDGGLQEGKAEALPTAKRSYSRSFKIKTTDLKRQEQQMLDRSAPEAGFQGPCDFISR
jgi:hypothetical protein